MNDFNDYEDDLLNETYQRYKVKIDNAYKIYRDYKIKNNFPYPLNETKYSSMWWCKRALIVYKHLYPHALNEFITEENGFFWNRIAGSYNVLTGKHIPLKPAENHNLESKNFENGWCRYYIYSKNNSSHTCGIEALCKEYAHFLMKILKNEYSELYITTYVLEYYDEDNNLHTKYFDEKGRKKMLDEVKQNILNIDKEIKQILENAGVGSSRIAQRINND